jgi:DNA polymerase-3 subunit epsilon
MSNFITTTRSGQLLRAQMVPVFLLPARRTKAMSGYVLTVENITRSIEQEARRDQVTALTDRRQPLLAGQHSCRSNQPDRLSGYGAGIARALRQVWLMTKRPA